MSKITAVLNKDAHPGLIETLRDAGIKNMQVSAGRTEVLQERRGFFGIRASGTDLMSDPVDIISFLVDKVRETDMLSLIADKARLHIPGMGTVYGEELNLIRSHELCGKNTAKKTRGLIKPANLYTELSGICCIVQRGQGDQIARVVLESGACVPTITFGDGTGVRDKLGLLRITIPADKDVINLVLSSYDADVVMELMIAAGNLDQPGRGFIYLFPVSRGIINTRITRGSSGHAASMEQIITVLDLLKGGMEWRRRGATESGRNGKRTFMKGLVDLTLVCNEGRGNDLVRAAMSSGATGATICKIKFIGPTHTDGNRVSPAREVCNMIVAQHQVDDTVAAVGKAGIFNDQTHGLVLTNSVPKAFTYIAKG